MVVRIVPPWLTTTSVPSSGSCRRAGAPRGRAVGDLGLQLATAPAHRLAALPRGVLIAVPRDDLLVRQALPDTRVRLAQALVVRHVEAGERGQLARGVRRPLQVRGDDPVGLQGRQQPGRAAGLAHAGLGELDIRGALEAALHVPQRLAVAPRMTRRPRPAFLPVSDSGLPSAAGCPDPAVTAALRAARRRPPRPGPWRARRPCRG